MPVTNAALDVGTVRASAKTFATEVPRSVARLVAGFVSLLGIVAILAVIFRQ